jgi:two-component system sensor histidine kinase UhpB
MTKPPDAWLASITPVLATALDAVIVMGEDGLIVGWNAIAEKVFGWSEREAIGRELSELIIPHRFREAHQRGVKRYVETGNGPLLNRRVEICVARVKSFPSS